MYGAIQSWSSELHRVPGPTVAAERDRLVEPESRDGAEEGREER